MSKSFFVPYVSSAEVNDVQLVTPWGNIKLNKGFMEQLAFSVSVVVLTVMLWRCSARLSTTLKKKTATKETIEEEEEKEAGEEEEAEAEEEEEKEEEEEEDDDNAMKAELDEKTVKKGENCYYYSHEHLETIDNDKTTVSSYGWSDSKKTIRQVIGLIDGIYLTDYVVTDMKEEQLTVKWTNMSLSMDLLKTVGGDRAKSLVISNLFQEITDVTWTVNGDTLTIVLTKAQEIPWTSLNGAARKMEDHIEYDSAFYD